MSERRQRRVDLLAVEGAARRRDAEAGRLAGSGPRRPAGSPVARGRGVGGAVAVCDATRSRPRRRRRRRRGLTEPRSSSRRRAAAGRATRCSDSDVPNAFSTCGRVAGGVDRQAVGGHALDLEAVARQERGDLVDLGLRRREALLPLRGRQELVGTARCRASRPAWVNESSAAWSGSFMITREIDRGVSRDRPDSWRASGGRRACALDLAPAWRPEAAPAGATDRQAGRDRRDRRAEPN